MFDFRVRLGARVGDEVARYILFLCGLSVLMVLGFIVFVLVEQSLEFFAEIRVTDFFFGTEWRQPTTVEISEGANRAKYGVLPLVTGTLLVTMGAVIIGLPVGVATAIYLAEYAPDRLRRMLKPVLELLAGIPSIVFGFFALHAVSPIVQKLTDPGSLLWYIFGKQEALIFNALNGIIVVGIMVIPIITALSEDAIRAVPRHLKEASLAVGATRWETTRHVVVPAALSGIVASFVLGVARAIGESMAVALAVGTTPQLTFNPAHTVQTMTAFIVQRTGGDTPQEGAPFTSLFAVGLVLFAMTLILNIIAQRFVNKYREKDGGNL